MSLSLKKNFSFALIGNLFYAASQYIILLVFVKLYSVEDVGIFVYAGAFTSPLLLALEMQLRNFFITDHDKKVLLNDYVAFRIITNIIGIITLAIAAFYVKPEFFMVILIVALIKVFESQLDLIYGVYQKENRLDYVAYSRIIRGILAIIVVTIVSFIFRDLIYSLLAYFFSWVILYFFYERKQVVIRGYVSFDQLRLVVPKKEQMKILIVLCAPMFISIFIDKYYLNYPRVIVEKMLGVKMLGIFGSLLYFKSLGGQFIASLAQSAIPKLSNYVKVKNIKPFNKLLFKMVLIGMSIGLVLSVLAYLGGKPLLTLLYKKEYADYANVLSIILLGTTVTFSYIFIATALTCIRKQWVKLPIAIVSFSILFLWIYFCGIKNLMDIALIVLYVETITFILYYLVYIFYVRKEVSNWKASSNL